ncbi:Type II secretion pathway protein D homolog [hydrothermal vent metagenome]|uniref:Type II secretion pathway protein D homolog n=1 Tax=hydrothermal vent metagenome TaxID=652676 RepID=A0A3B0VW17_9ZZZZ
MLANSQAIRGCFTVVSIFFIIMSLTGCPNMVLEKEQVTAEEFVPDGHLLASPTIKNEQNNSSPIPNIIGSTPPKLPSFRGASASHYSITAVNVPVVELLFQVAKDAGRQIDLYKGIKGNVTINALNQPLEKILERISEQAGFMFSVEGNTIKVQPDLPEWRNYKVDYVNVSKVSEDSIDMRMMVSSPAGGGAGKSTKGSFSRVTVKSEHNFWKKLEENVKLLAQLDPSNKKGKIAQNTVINPEAGVISVYTSAKKHKAIKKYIRDVTIRVERQVLIEATVVEVLLNDQFQAGIDWSVLDGRAFGKSGGLKLSSPSFGLSTGANSGFSVATLNPSGAVGGIATGDWNILANLQLLKTFGDSKVLSSPKIMAINNQTALLKVVENLVYFTVDVNTTAATATTVGLTTYESEINTVPVGFTMSVTPFVSENGNVTLNVRPTISRKVGEVLDPNPALKEAGVENNIPIIQEKEMSSVLLLKDGQTAVIGGLIEDLDTQNRLGLPWFSDIPVIGNLFSSQKDRTKKTELVIFIRPTIIKNPDISNGDLQQVGRFLKTHPNNKVK